MQSVVWFDHPFDTSCGTKCYTRIKITPIEYSGNSGTKYYKISYTHRFVDGDGRKMFSDGPPIEHPHPFADDDDKTLAEQADGVLVVRNALTEQAVLFLGMKDKELQKHTGNTRASDYRRTIMHDLARKWE